MYLTPFTKHSKKAVISLIALALVSWGVVSCKKDTLITNSGAKLSFSSTQILFDTVFTTVGSTFQYFTVHNYHNQPIKISSITLAGNYTSPFKINVDGVAGSSFSNITIPANDSIFVFVTVTLNPNNTNNPLVIEDSLQFTTNGNNQYVDLTAWGQDAYFYKPNVFPANGPAYSVLPCGTIWRNDKPHVVFGYLVVDSLCNLTIQAGAKVYMHGNGTLFVNAGGTLTIAGLPNNPVTIQGDRLEPAYQTVPGQWGEIWLSAGSINNNIDWAIIKNGTVGIECDTLGKSTNPTLVINHTIIKSMSNVGLLGQGSYITGYDDLIADCQNYCIDLSLGGNYTFIQSTFANYWSYSQRQTTTLLVDNWYQDVYGNYQSRPLANAYFGNCIVWGSSTANEELQIDSSHGGIQPFNVKFQNCDLLTKQNTAITFHYDSIYNENPNFISSGFDNYALPTGSLGGLGNPSFCKYQQGAFGAQDLNNATFQTCPTNLGAYSSN